MRKTISLVLFCFLPSLSAKEIKNFSLPLYKESKTFHLGKVLKRHEKILINFWASWCTGIEELKELEELKSRYKKVLFVGINAGESKRKIKRFIEKYHFSYLILEDKERIMSKELEVNSLPQTIVVGKNKQILYRGNRPPKEI